MLKRVLSTRDRNVAVRARRVTSNKGGGTNNKTDLRSRYTNDWSDMTVFGIDRMALWCKLRDSNDQNFITSAGKWMKQFFERSETNGKIETDVKTARGTDAAAYLRWSCRTNRTCRSPGTLWACARRVSVRRTGARLPAVSPAIWSSARCCGASTASTRSPWRRRRPARDRSVGGNARVRTAYDGHDGGDGYGHGHGYCDGGHGQRIPEIGVRRTRHRLVLFVWPANTLRRRWRRPRVRGFSSGE